MGGWVSFISHHKTNHPWNKQKIERAIYRYITNDSGSGWLSDDWIDWLKDWSCKIISGTLNYLSILRKVFLVQNYLDSEILPGTTSAEIAMPQAPSSLIIDLPIAIASWSVTYWLCETWFKFWNAKANSLDPLFIVKSGQPRQNSWRMMKMESMAVGHVYVPHLKLFVRALKH